MIARVRPITVMAATAVVALVLVAAFTWTRHDETVVGQPGALPIVLGARAESAMAPATTTTGSRTYVAGAGLVDPGPSLAAWSVSSVEVDPAAVRRLAEAFGVSGDLRPIEGGWQIGADGEASVRVASSPGASWTYSIGGPPQIAMVCSAPASGLPAPAPSSAAASDLPLPAPTPAPGAPTSSGDVGVDGCTSTPAPEDVPTAAAAETATRDLLRRIGLDVAHMAVSGTTGPWGAQATATPELAGTATRGIDTVVAFGAHAAVTSASGWLGHPTKGDTYPLIGIDAAIGRLNDGRDLLDGLGPMPAGVSTGVSTGVTTDGLAPGGVATDGGAAGVAEGAGTAVDAPPPPITSPVTTIPVDGSATSTGGPTAPTTDWRCAVPLTAPGPGAESGSGAASSSGAESSSGGGPTTTSTVVGTGDGDAGGSGGGAPSCPGVVCPAPPCPSGMACTDGCAVPTCDPVTCGDPRPGPTVVPEPADPPVTAPDARGVVTITSVDLVLAAVPGADGSLWLVPAYVLTGDDGSTATVLAVDESFVAPPSSSGSTGATATPATGTEIAPSSVPVPPPVPGSEPAPTPDPTQAPGQAPGPAPATATTPCTAPWMC